MTDEDFACDVCAIETPVLFLQERKIKNTRPKTQRDVKLLLTKEKLLNTTDDVALKLSGQL